MKRIATLVTGMALIAPGTALAQGSSQCQAYNSGTCTVGATQAATTSSSSPTATASTTSSSSSTLPFTGLDVGLLVAGGGTLLGAGLVVRRVSRRLE